MAPLSKLTQYTLVVALLVPCALSLWVMAVPATMTPSTLAVATTLFLSLCGVVLLSVRNGRSAGTIGDMHLNGEQAATIRPSRPYRGVQS